MQAEPTAGVVPIHHKIADAIRAQIESGELRPGDPVPTVAELSERWRCAPGSARSALAVLKGEGRITSGRGKAAAVRQPPRRIKLTIDWTQEQKDLVLRPRAERARTGAIELTAGISIDDTISTHRYSRTTATDELAREFGIEPGAPLVRRLYEMTEQATGHRLSHSMSHIPLALIEANPDLLDEKNEPWPGGHQHQLYTVGIEIDHFVRSVIALEPTPGDRQKWGMDLGVPLLRVRSRSVDTAGRVVEISDATYPADRTEIFLTERLERWPAGHSTYSKEDD